MDQKCWVGFDHPGWMEKGGVIQDVVMGMKLHHVGGVQMILPADDMIRIGINQQLGSYSTP